MLCLVIYHVLKVDSVEIYRTSLNFDAFYTLLARRENDAEKVETSRPCIGSGRSCFSRVRDIHL